MVCDAIMLLCALIVLSGVEIPLSMVKLEGLFFTCYEKQNTEGTSRNVGFRDLPLAGLT